MKLSTSDKDNLIENVTQLLAAYSGLPEGKISSESRIVADLGMDSFSIVELTYELEMKYGAHITNDDLKKIKTVGDIVGIVRESL